ncbi:hypothetical protein D9Q98_006110 [Chlorella vulgaris]|uniref:CHY-type domain-containing protein n=1 Tax=Chlorella vulgaris TaxID=3077 RepID=A0A9D4Z0Z1_CHLVU|nr:hypothetical protein D9Q98_006110 [Chlorella vulgaris]
MTPPPRTESLQLLQAELLQLKRQVLGLQLRRSTAAESPTHPFPISARAEIAAPPDAERFDVSAFTLLVRLNTPSPQPSVDPVPEEEQQAQAAVDVAVEVCSEELPAALREAMAKKLHSLWMDSLPGAEGGHLNLALLWSEARRQYASLLSLVPHLLESYQREDASGSTARRWAVLSDNISVTIDTAPHHTAAAAKQPPAPPGRAPSQRPAAAATRLRDGGLSRPAVEPAPKPALQSSGGAELTSGGLPRGLQTELVSLQRRHGLRLMPLQDAAAAAARSAAPAAALAAGDAAASHLAGLSLADASAAAKAGAATANPPDKDGVPAAASGGSSVVAAFQLKLQPTDPAWPAQHPLLLHGWAAAAYPQPGSLFLEVSEEQQPPLALLHRQVLQKLVAGEVAAAAGRPGALRSVLRYLENHAGQLWQQAEDIAAEVARRRRQQEEQQAQPSSRLPGARLNHPANSESDDDSYSTGSGHSHSSCSNSSAYSSKGSSRSGSSSDGDGEEGGAMAGRSGTTNGGGGGGYSDAVLPLVLLLEGLNLVDVDALELLRLNLQVSCQRCRAAGELSFATAAVALPSEPSRGGGGGGGGGKGRASGLLTAAAECGTCHAEWAVEVAPKLVHERSNVMAHLRAEGCLPADLLPSMLAAQCSHCSSSAAFRSVAVGPWNERTCSSCHTPMRFQFSAAIFAPHRQAGSAQQRSGAGAQQAGSEQRRGGGGGAAASAAAFQGLLQVGQPLPDRGTCEHYRHSYRWLRFPCCGRRFPCDLCHEELTDGHEMQWARRMVCGLCSTEQSVAPECKACGKKVATSASAPTGRRTRFWEGGKGQRDPTKLHRDDPRRHRSRNKTRSAKSKRVGAEGKARREREQQQ